MKSLEVFFFFCNFKSHHIKRHHHTSIYWDLGKVRVEEYAFLWVNF